MYWIENALSCYWVFAVAWSIYQGARGALEHHVYTLLPINHNTKWKRFALLYLHDFFFRFVCTMAGFIALLFAYTLAQDLDQLDPGMATVMAAAFLVGVIGVGGQLHYVILFGKVDYGR